MAMTADGKIATENRRAASFGTRHDHDLLYRLRARADAVMTGARTLREQNADLNSGGPKYQRLRVRNGLPPENLRVVVSGSARLDLNSRVFRERGGPILLLTTTTAPISRLRALRRAGVQVGQFGKHQVDLAAAARWLRERWKVRHLHCEGGGELNDAMFRAGLVDELYLTVCPLLVAGRLAPTIADGQGVTKLAEASRFKLASVRQVGSELFLRFQRAPSSAPSSS